MSFQISYTVKNPPTDFTWMDVSETKEIKNFDSSPEAQVILRHLCH